MQFRSTIALLVAALGAASACRKAEPAPQQKPAEVAAPAAAAPAPAPAPAPAVIAKPLLWEVEKDGKQLQLLGTFHLGVDAARELPPWVWQRFDAAHTFAMEADVMDPSLLAALRRTDGTTLDQELGAAHWAKLEQAIGADTAARLKTLAASAVTTVVMTHGLPPTAPMDMTLLERARAGGKAIVYLEPVDVQVRVLRWLDGTTLKAMLDDPQGAAWLKYPESLSEHLVSDRLFLVEPAMDVAEGQDDIGATGGDGGRLARVECRHLDRAIDRVAGDFRADPLVIAPGRRNDVKSAARGEIGGEDFGVPAASRP